MTINFELYTRASSGTGLGTSLDTEAQAKTSLVTNLAERISAHFGPQIGTNYVINNHEGSFYVRFKNSETREISYIPLDGESEEAALCRQIFNVTVAKKPEPAPPTASQDDLKIADLRTAIREREKFFSTFTPSISDLFDTSLSNRSKSLKDSLERVQNEKESLEATIQRLTEKKELLQNPENYWQAKIDFINKELKPQQKKLAELQRNPDENRVKIIVLKEKMKPLERILEMHTRNKTTHLDPKVFLQEQAEKYGEEGNVEEGLQKEIDKEQARLTTLNEREKTYLERQRIVQESIERRAAQGDLRLQSILDEPMTDKKEYITKLEVSLSEYDQTFDAVKEKLKGLSSLFLQFKRNAVTRLEEIKSADLNKIAEIEREIAAEPAGSRKIPRLQHRITLYQEKAKKLDGELLEAKVELEREEQKEKDKQEAEQTATEAERKKAAQRAAEKAGKEAAEAARKQATERAEAEKRAARSAMSAMNSPRLTSLDYIFQLASLPSSSA